MLNYIKERAEIIPFPVERISRLKKQYDGECEIVILPVVRYEYDYAAPSTPKKKRAKAS